MLQTARAILKRDPAAHSLWEVLLTYPGLHALFWHRIAHFLANHGRYVLAALVSRFCTHRTGIIIAPEAQIGKRVFIDHGTGVVIGATAIVEDDVTILHGVTLGARDEVVNGRRHPYVRQGAFIGANAQVLGPISVGRYSKIGAGAVVLKDVPDNMTAVGNPARLVTHKRTGWVTYRYSEMIVGQRMEG
ncbi:serine O-acetyltransferase EpsC [Secundilactobacillus collinoides]|uniref:Serine acetyltransferase n=1 Tax=Secundilactobacillus collinoides TaxID=33960 RepID=A0A166HN98_SECCO|nr:serine O-acetyltransferase EpsC [Secundilactobacillus collinoides]KZL42920.1 serine acetyltransferase [Secundilactobacillus collinoides]